MTEELELLSKLLSYDTRVGIDKPGKEIKIMLEELIDPILVENGFETELINSKGHWSILGKREGNGPKILLSGHVDVIPWVIEEWDTDPNSMVHGVKDGVDVVYGRGTSDMLSGVAAILIALPEMIKSEASLYITITGDEEIGGINGTGKLLDILKSRDELPDYVITADAATMDIVVRRRNTIIMEFSIKKEEIEIEGNIKEIEFSSKIISGETSHAAYFNKEVDIHCLGLANSHIGENNILPSRINGNFVAINVIPHKITLFYVTKVENSSKVVYDKGLQKLFQLSQKMLDLDFKTEKYSSYEINSTPNVVKENTENWKLFVDVRAMISRKNMIIEETVQQIIDELDHEITFEIIKSEGFVATDENNPLVQAAKKVLNELGYRGNTVEMGGATDGRYFGQLGIPTIDIGTIGWNEHGPNEHMAVKSLLDLTKFFQMITRYLIEITDNDSETLLI